MQRIVVAAVLLLPLAAAHDAGPEQYQSQMWADGAYLASLPQDGYDLRSLIAWEAYQEEPGLMVHWHMVGGDVTGAYDAYRVNLTFEVGNASTSMSWWTEDHASWSGDAELMLDSNETEGALPESSRWQHAVQAFIPLSMIRASVGDDVGGFRMDSYAYQGDNASHVDQAPGGYFALGAPAELPEPGLDGSIDADSHSSTSTRSPSMFLQGPGRHLRVEGSWDGGQVTMEVANPYNAAWQNITMQAPDDASPQEAQAVALAPGMAATFHYDVPLEDAAKDWDWEVFSDIGGHAELRLRLPAQEQPPPEPIIIERTDPQAEPPSDGMDGSDGADGADGSDGAGGSDGSGENDAAPSGEDSPLGVWLGIVALGVVLALRRR